MGSSLTVVEADSQLDLTLTLPSLEDGMRRYCRKWRVINPDHPLLHQTRLNFGEVGFEHCLREEEQSINGREKLRRLQDMGKTPLPITALFSLIQDYQDKARNSVLEWLRTDRGIVFVDFLGTPICQDDGEECVAYACCCDARWCMRCRAIDSECRKGHRSATAPE